MVVINDDLRPGLNGAGSSVSQAHSQRASTLVRQTGRVIRNPKRPRLQGIYFNNGEWTKVRPRLEDLYENKGKWSKERKRNQREMKPLQAAAYNERQREKRKLEKKKMKKRKKNMRKIKEVNIKRPSNDKRIKMWRVWGELPPNLSLEIYKKLPLQSFYGLREVCKDWNLVARERRCVNEPIHKPYFVLTHEGGVSEEENGFYLHGILTFHITSRKGRWNNLLEMWSDDPSPPHKSFSVKGLTFSCYLPEGGENYGVFDTHTKNENIVPREPETPKRSYALGMTVDTSVVPHTFKVILGSVDIGTQIYDSLTKSWETRPSLMVNPCGVQIDGLRPCLHCGNSVYIWSHLDTILVYSLEADMWSSLKPPPRSTSDLSWYSLGSWHGCIFTVTCDRKAIMWERTYDEFHEDVKQIVPGIAPLLWVWMLVDHCEQTLWEKVAEMPEVMQRWLIPLRLQVVEIYDVEIHTSFCDEHLLIYSWVPDQEGRAYRFVLYNVATKTWEKVEVPDHVSINPHNDNDTDKWDFPEELISSMDSDDDCIGATDSEDDYIGDDFIGF
ncbi:hypothetical protein M758_1G064900 [Ceratodon purpureus]|nr:hypothetical protein M758_1G064900 [Ceratodon purpureus]